jgi:hypothetical protein
MVLPDSSTMKSNRFSVRSRAAAAAAAAAGNVDLLFLRPLSFNGASKVNSFGCCGEVGLKI